MSPTSPSSFAAAVALPFALAIALAPSAAAQATEQEHLAQNVFAQMRWRELGPVSFGGRIVDLAVHPRTPQVFWAAAASGGLWKTTNGGTSFVPQFQDAYSISIGDIAVAPSDGDVLYVGTGESNNQRSSYWGNGVYKTTDGGKTFAHVGLDGTEHIGRIAVHPLDPDVVFVAALGALYSPSDARGLYRSKDGGRSWERVQHLGPDTGFVDVAFDPQHPDVLYAASYERRRRAWHLTEGGEGSRLWRSRDAGSTWQQLAGGLPAGVLGRIGLDVFAGDGRIVYATIENLNPIGTLPTAPVAPPDGDDPRDPRDPRDAGGDGHEDDRVGDGELPRELPAEVVADPVALADFERKVAQAQDPERRPRRKTIGGEVWRTEDGGDTWKKTHGRDVQIGGSPGYYYGQIRVDPSDQNRVFVLSVPVYRSLDAGKTWTPAPGRGRGRGGAREQFAPGLHVDHHALWIDPDDGRHCLLGNDGGLAITWDGGAHWDHLAHLPIAQFYTVAIDARSPYRVYGGLQDNGTWGFPIHGATSAGIQAHDAYRIDGGDGFFVCCDSTDPDVVYSESQFGGMSRQDLRTGERKGIKPKARKGEQPLRFNWMTPMLLSPHAPHTLYAGSQFVHRSRDRGDTWTTISADLTTNDPAKLKGNVPHCTITMLAESPRQEGWLWAGTDDGRVWTTRDGGQRWTELTERFPATTRGLWVSRIAASPHAAATAFVAFTGYREDRREPFVFRTDDGGETWLPIAHDLPQEPVNVIVQHPQNASVLFVGTEFGAYASIDDGAHWYRLGGNLPRVAVHDLAVHPQLGHVLVGTHGRGIWALDGAAFAVLTTAELEKAFAALPPSDGALQKRAFSRGNQGARTWSAANPFVQPTFRYLLREDSEDKVTVEVLDATGRVLWTHEGETKAGYHEVAWAQRGGRGGGPGGQGGPGAFFGAGARASGPRPGSFAVRITCGEASSVQAFAVRDLRGPRSVIGAVPGFGAAGEDEELESDRR